MTAQRVERVDEVEAARKAWAHLRAIFALAGYAVYRRPQEGGFRVHRGPAWSVDLPDLRAVVAFGERAGIGR